MNNIFNNKYSAIPKMIRDQLIVAILDEQFDIELIFYKIKHNQNIQHFSETIVNVMEEIIDNVPQNNQKINCSAIIAECFVYHDNQSPDWVCYHCGNWNHAQYINNKLKNNISICCLCGITQIDSIMY
eukprot:262418_1